MNRRFLFTFLTCVLLLASCSGTADAPAPSASIEAWVESPHEGSILPMGVVPLTVYASSAEGISYIHIKVNGESLPAIAAAPLTTDGSARLVRVDYAFTPPAEGEYVVTAAGVNAAGASGGFGSTRFCIVTCEAGAAPVPAETGTPTPAFFETEPSLLPTEAVPPTLAPPTIEPPTIAPPTYAPPTIPPPSDTSGPSINSASVYWNGCSLYGAADATDPSGVSDVEYWYNFNGAGWQIIAMNQSGSEWTSQLGVDTFGAPGTLEYKFHAVDSLGNQSWSGLFTKNFAYCGD